MLQPFLLKENASSRQTGSMAAITCCCCCSTRMQLARIRNIGYVPKMQRLLRRKSVGKNYTSSAKNKAVLSALEATAGRVG